MNFRLSCPVGERYGYFDNPRYIEGLAGKSNPPLHMYLIGSIDASAAPMRRQAGVFHTHIVRDIQDNAGQGMQRERANRRHAGHAFCSP
jgi:hypothetical protein